MAMRPDMPGNMADRVGWQKLFMSRKGKTGGHLESRGARAGGQNAPSHFVPRP